MTTSTENTYKDYIHVDELVKLIHGEPWASICYGVYLGYSVEAIVGFIRRYEFVMELIRRYDRDLSIDFIEASRPWHIPTAVGTPFYKTGYIPTPSDIRKGYEAVVNEINARRFCPFPYPDKFLRTVNIEGLTKAIKNNPEFVIRLNEVIEEIREHH